MSTRPSFARLPRPTLTLALVAGVALTAFTAARSLNAQAGGTPLTGRVACVDVIKVFNEFQRQRDLTEEMAELQLKIETELTERRGAISALQAEINNVDPADPTYFERTRKMLIMQIDFKNWVELKQADMKREIGVWSIRIYKEIAKAVEDIAKRDGYDLVLYKGQFDPPGNLDPDQIKELIRTTQILYSNQAIDVSTAVLDKLNADYRAKPREKMMFVP